MNIKEEIIKEANDKKLELPLTFFTNHKIKTKDVIFTNDVVSAYSIIAGILGLKHLKENIFVDKNYKKVFWDKYGFHNVIQYTTIKYEELRLQLHYAKIKDQDLYEKEKLLNKAFKELEKEKRSFNDEKRTIIGKKKDRVIRDIINSSNLSSEDKLNNILDFLNEKHKFKPL